MQLVIKGLKEAVKFVEKNMLDFLCKTLQIYNDRILQSAK